MSEADALFFSWDWISSWIENYLDDNTLLCLVARERDKTIGIAPLWIDHNSELGLFKLRVVRFLGSTEVCPDHLDFLTRRKQASQVAAAFLDHLLGPLNQEWDSFEYHQVPTGSAALNGLWNLAENDDRCVKQRIDGYSICPYIPLPARWDDYLKALSENQRRSLKITTRLLSEQGELELRFCSSESDLKRELELLMELNQKSWNRRGEAGSFATDRVRKFHSLVAQRFLAQKKLIFCSLWLYGSHLGSFYGFEVEQKVYFYIIAVEQNPHPRVSVGRYLLARCVEEAIERGCTEFDMLRGDEVYKYQWTDQFRRNLLVTFYNRSFRSFAYLLSGFVIDYTKRLVKSFLERKALTDPR